MADGTHKPIDAMKVGDKVTATNPETGAAQTRAVTTTFSSTGTKDLVQITVNGAKKRTDVLTATANHPFCLPEQSRWADVGELKPGMWLRTGAGTHVQITTLGLVKRYRRAHNFTVEALRHFAESKGLTHFLDSTRDEALGAV
ncbi:polymorphic toxin-type HINT domain-containing protein [Actinomadura flavalba]|uniref:polymorphic toxin-type HINT domain-containing protein n=1 Tax=Actinomadura flavalba TaxID=1120938 RepID=UPI0012DE52C7|nr:polymorphic toxin-type HINT domain-containing protein [Actinomadura flavalba]